VSLFWWACAVWTGASLVAVAPTRGMAACGVLAVAGEAVLAVIGLTVLRHEVLNASTVIVYTAAALLPAPLLTGGVLVRRRAIAGDRTTEAISNDGSSAPPAEKP